MYLRQCGSKIHFIQNPVYTLLYSEVWGGCATPNLIFSCGVRHRQAQHEKTKEANGLSINSLVMVCAKCAPEAKHIGSVDIGECMR